MSAFVLKIIACVSMFIGHLPFVFSSSSLAHGMVYIGKFAFPIYAFLISEGYSKTKNFSKYLTRLLVFAVISQPFARLLFFGTIKVLYFNIFFTLAFGLLSIMFIDKLNNKFLAYILVFGLASLAELLKFDFGLIGVFLIVSFFVFKTRPNLKILVQISLVIILFIHKSFSYITTISNIRYLLIQLIFTLIALLIPVFYNGKKGKSNKVIQISFYCFYPVHLLFLYLLRFFV